MLNLQRRWNAEAVDQAEGQLVEHGTQPEENERMKMRIGDVIDFQVSFEGLPSLALRYHVLGHNLDGANNSLLRSRVQLFSEFRSAFFLLCLVDHYRLYIYIRPINPECS